MRSGRVAGVADDGWMDFSALLAGGVTALIAASGTTLALARSGGETSRGSAADTLAAIAGACFPRMEKAANVAAAVSTTTAATAERTNNERPPPWT